MVKLNTEEMNAGTVEAAGSNKYGQCTISD